MKAGKPIQSPDCWTCRHHYITHDPRFPYGCRAMNFRSRRLPGTEVFAASQMHCLQFRNKKAG